MKTLVIYSSQTGFTEKYAKLLADKLGAELLTIKEAKKKKGPFFEEYEAIVYGGWVRAGSVVDAKWFVNKAEGWKDKKLAVFRVGASPEEGPGVAEQVNTLLTEEQRKYIEPFYCQGGLDYDKMNLPSKMMMRALISVLSKKADKTEEDEQMIAMISDSFDMLDEKNIEPIVKYIAGE